MKAQARSRFSCYASYIMGLGLGLKKPNRSPHFAILNYMATTYSLWDFFFSPAAVTWLLGYWWSLVLKGILYGFLLSLQLTAKTCQRLFLDCRWSRWVWHYFLHTLGLQHSLFVPSWITYTLATLCSLS